MPGWISVQEALRMDPDFFKKRGENSWTSDPENIRISSNFGFAEDRVQLKDDGTLDFDRVVYGEAPNINAVVWGKDADGNIKVGVTIQARPFADNPNGTPADPPLIFAQPCVMGFLQRIVGEPLASAFEKADQGALREAMEEAGVSTIKDIRYLGHHNPNPTFVATWSQLLEIEVDLQEVSEHTDRAELIYRAEYLSLEELFARIGSGVHRGINYRSATANDAFLVWLVNHFRLTDFGDAKLT